MPIDPQQHPLVALANHRDVTARSLFLQTSRELTEEQLAVDYAVEQANAPHRADARKTYLIPSHTGIPASGDHTNRHEEHLALAIFHAFQPPRPGLMLPDGHRLQLLEYQLPLYASMNDAGIGKVDLFGLDSQNQPVIVELKGAHNQETPLRALLEGLAYSAMIQANVVAITREVQEQYGLAIQHATPRLVIMAPELYWQQWNTRSSYSGWAAQLLTLAATVRRATRVQVDFTVLTGAEFTHGLAGTKPTLTATPGCRDALTDA